MRGHYPINKKKGSNNAGEDTSTLLLTVGVISTPRQVVINTTTKLNHTTVNTKPNDGMKNTMRWELLLIALYANFEC